MVEEVLLTTAYCWVFGWKRIIEYLERLRYQETCLGLISPFVSRSLHLFVTLILVLFIYLF